MTTRPMMMVGMEGGSLAYWHPFTMHTHTHTKSNHVSLFSSFLAADAAAAAVTVRPYVIRWRWMNHQQQRQQ